MNLNQKLKNRNSPHQVKLPEGEPPKQLAKKQDFDAIEIQEREEFNPVDGKLDEKRSNQEVTLEVEDREDEYIVVRVYHGLLHHEQHLLTEPIKAPQLSFAKQMQKEKIKMKIKMHEIIGAMRKFSQKNYQARQICHWLIKLKNKLEVDWQQQFIYLRIEDRTDFEIPWEMLELKLNNYLGALFTTVRWQEIPDPNNDENESGLIPLEVKTNNCCGQIVAYLNTDNLSRAKQEKEIIQQFHHHCCEKFYPFLDYLDGIESEVSLIFIGGHGFLEDDIGSMTLGGIEIKKKTEIKQEISLNGLYSYDFDFLANNGSIVFMNACHSGRLHKDCQDGIIPQTGRYPRIGFPTFFLDKGAKGVIGTLNKVDDNYAAKIAKNFFVEHERNPQLSVATILRNLRQNAVEQLQAEKNDENRYLFFFTFMYIYYGNPMTKLKLSKA